MRVSTSDRPRVYLASRAKRHRSTKAEVEARRNALHKIVANMHPMTVRQVFYQATIHELVEKTDAGYDKVQTDLVLMRRAGELPYHWLADNTRWQRKPQTFSSPREAIAETARFYRKALWADVAPILTTSATPMTRSPSAAPTWPR